MSELDDEFDLSIGETDSLPAIVEELAAVERRVKAIVW